MNDMSLLFKSSVAIQNTHLYIWKTVESKGKLHVCLKACWGTHTTNNKQPNTATNTYLGRQVALIIKLSFPSSILILDFIESKACKLDKHFTNFCISPFYTLSTKIHSLYQNVSLPLTFTESCESFIWALVWSQNSHCLWNKHSTYANKGSKPHKYMATLVLLS